MCPNLTKLILKDTLGDPQSVKLEDIKELDAQKDANKSIAAKAA